MRNRSGVVIHDRLFCLYFSSSPGLFCPQFLFLLTVCLSVGLGLFSSLPFSASILVRSQESAFVQVQQRRALQVPGVLCDPSRSQLNAQGWAKVQAQPHPSWAELSPEVQVKRAGARDHSGTHPAARTRDAECYFCSSPSAWWQLSLIEIDLVCFLLRCSLFPPSSASCRACATAGRSCFMEEGRLIIIAAIPKLPLLYRSAFNSGLN